MQIFRDLIYSISATNMVDMVIIASLIYLFLSWMKGTRAFQIMASMLVIGLVYYVASKMGLILTSVLFQYLWAAIIVVLVIVFQPEIRHMLDRASPIRYLSGRSSTPVLPSLIDETVNAVAELARWRIGALIVFQRLDRLDNVILKGKELDAVLSSETLVTIFQKTSPLHDGAVLVHRDRISAASCILPLSTDETLSSQYGTRHRAAVGLAERSDAVCVVVSEERGEVSLVVGSTITNHKRKGDFTEALQKELAAVTPLQHASVRGILSSLVSDWRLKLLSLGTAVLLWFVVVGPRSSEVGISVPIQYINLPAEMEITGKWADRIDVRLRGSESSLANLRPGSVRVLVDLSAAIPGLNFFRISEKNMQVPPGIVIGKIRPQDLDLRIEAASVRKFLISPNVKGSLPPNVKVSITPPEVRVRALQDDLKKVMSVTTKPVNVSDLLENKKVTVPVSVQPDGIRIDGVEPLEVSISIEEGSP